MFIFVTVKQSHKQPHVILGVLWVKQPTKKSFATFKTRDHAMAFKH